MKAVILKKPTRPSLEDAVHSVDDACALLKVSRSTIYSLIGSGALRVRKVGRRTLVTNLREFVAELKAA